MATKQNGFLLHLLAAKELHGVKAGRITGTSMRILSGTGNYFARLTRSRTSTGRRLRRGAGLCQCEHQL